MVREVSFPVKNGGMAFFRADVLDGGSDAMDGDGGMGAPEAVLEDAEVEQTRGIPLTLTSSKKGDSGFCTEVWRVRMWALTLGVGSIATVDWS